MPMESWVAMPMKRSFMSADIRAAGAAYSQNMKKVDMILRSAKVCFALRDTHGKIAPF